MIIRIRIRLGAVYELHEWFTDHCVGATRVVFNQYRWVASDMMDIYQPGGYFDNALCSHHFHIRDFTDQDGVVIALRWPNVTFIDEEYDGETP